MNKRGVDPMISKCTVEILVCGSKPSKSKKAKMRFKNGRWLQVVNKLDEDQIKWIVRQNRNGTYTNREIANIYDISMRWVQKICARYKDKDPATIKYPDPMGRPQDSMPGRREQSAVLSNHTKNRRSAVRLEKIIRIREGIHIPHSTIHRILKDEELAENHPAKAKQRKYIRFERRFSNSLWHTDYKQLYDRRWFIAYMDDASRFIVGFGIFDEATTENALKVLESAIKMHGKPAQILTDHGSQFYANEKEATKRGESDFEKKLVEFDIKQVLARIRHPQTNGKLERFHSEIEQHLDSFEKESATNTVRDMHEEDHVGSPFYTAGAMDPVSRLVDWYNNLEHTSLKDETETPVQAYLRKMPPKDITIEEMKEDIHG